MEKDRKPWPKTQCSYANCSQSSQVTYFSGHTRALQRKVWQKAVRKSDTNTTMTRDCSKWKLSKTSFKSASMAIMQKVCRCKPWLKTWNDRKVTWILRRLSVCIEILPLSAIARNFVQQRPVPSVRQSQVELAVWLPSRIRGEASTMAYTRTC